MTTLLIWWVAIALETVLLGRALYSRLVGKYPFFFLYLSSVVICDISLFCVSKLEPSAYPALSRQTEVLNIVLGYGILLEIFTHVLARYPGAERFARVAGLVVFVLVLCLALAYPLVSAGAPQSHFRYSVVERDFLAVQAIFLFVVFGVISYYRIDAGRNITGMIIGYGVWLGTSVAVLALGSYSVASFGQIRILVQPLSYLFSLLTWLSALWSYAPSSASPARLGLRADYESLAASTAETIGKMRAELARTARL